VNSAEISAKLADLARGYPPELVVEEIADARRQAFHLRLLASRVPAGGSVCDIGGGVGLFSIGCAALGFKTTLVDDFNDDVNSRFGEGALAQHVKLGVQVVRCDVTQQQLDLPAASFDAVTSFDSIEHWHHGARRALQGAMAALKPGGLFLLGAPNCVNLRKRLTVPFGRGKWSSMAEWYESEIFRGHVREPDVADFRFIARDLGLQRVRVFGRNWQGLRSSNALIRACATLADWPLRLFPSLCSDLYLLGFKGV
jgi:SAM-dependent methyltransferase